MDGNQNIQVVPRGGKREGAGRKGLLKSILADPRFAEARGINPLYASEVLGHVVDERKAWQRIFNSEDDRIILQGLMFLVAMRDGKPAQRINVTSTSLQLNASDLERARAIVAEIRQDLSPEPSPSSSHSSELASADNGLQGESTPRLGAGDTAGMVLEDSGRDSEDVAARTEKKSESQHNASVG